MKVTDRKRRMKQGLLNRIKKGIDEQGDTGKGIFRTDLKDVKFWNCKKGEHIIDIIPYLAGKNDPATNEGDPTYVLEVKIHYDVGPANAKVICLAETYGKPCPICEYRKKLQREGEDEDIISELKPSRWPRAIYNIVCYDSVEEEEKGVQVWHTSSFLMERYLRELAKVPRAKEGIEPYIAFADPDDGKSIAFSREGTGVNTKFIGHRFVDRDYVISDEILDSAYVLDELLYIPTYDEVYEMFFGRQREDSEEDEKKERKTEKDRSGVNRLRRRISKTKDPECPAGGVFGVDTNEFEECEECDYWMECAKKNQARLDEDVPI